jgi:hypothetical protein
MEKSFHPLLGDLLSAPYSYLHIDSQGILMGSSDFNELFFFINFIRSTEDKPI